MCVVALVLWLLSVGQIARSNHRHSKTREERTLFVRDVSAEALRTHRKAFPSLFGVLWPVRVDP